MMIRCLTTVLLAAGLALAGCKSNSTVDLDKPLGPFEPETPNEAARLRTQLVGFADYFSARVAATADEIAFSTHSRELQEMTLRWKLRVIPAMQAAVLVPDPRAALLDTWVLCAQNEEYLSGKQGALEFGEYQELALRTVRELKQEITNIAEGLLTPEAHAAVSEDIQALVAGSPIRGRFAIDLIRASEEIAANRDRGITELLSLPLGGVRESAEAIDRVARVTEVLTEVLEDLPERTRWQTELLLLEMERLETIEVALQELQILSSGIQSISETAQTLPKELHDTVADLLQQSNESQDKLQETLHQARNTIAELENALDSSQEVVAQVEVVTESFNDAATAWGETANTVNEVVNTINAMSLRESDPDSKPFDVTEYTAAANSIHDAAIEVQRLLTDLEDQPARASVEYLGGELDDSINRMIIGCLILIFGTLVAVVIYHVIVRLIRSR